MSASDHNYDVRPLIGEEDSLEDLSFSLGSKTWRMWGRDGAERERNLAERSTGTGLPVLLGSGLGVGLELLARNGPVAVVDREEPILELTGVQERFREDPNVLWLQNDTRECMKVLAEWQAEHGGRPLEPLAVPIYLRLDPDHYRTLATALAKGARADFWEEARYPKFRNSAPKVLLLERPYFLYREIAAALDRMGIERRNVDIGSGDTVRQGFVEDFLEAVVDFRPDMALTVNHLGLDREGRLTGLLERLGLPLASWFVDSPRLVLHEYQGLATPGTILFTWDKSSLEPLAAAGYQQTFHLPLATDPHLFQPDAPPPSRGAEHLPAGVSFVGASMIRQVRERLEYARPGPAFLRRLEAVAQALSGGVIPTCPACSKTSSQRCTRSTLPAPPWSTGSPGGPGHLGSHPALPHRLRARPAPLSPRDRRRPAVEGRPEGGGTSRCCRRWTITGICPGSTPERTLASTAPASRCPARSTSGSSTFRPQEAFCSRTGPRPWPNSSTRTGSASATQSPRTFRNW